MIKLTKSDLQNLYKKALNLVRTKPAEFFNLRKMRGTVGLCYFTDIELDYRRDIVPTAFHELFHYLYPDWSESQVKYAESRMINHCTPVEIATFLKYLANKIYKAEMIKLTHENSNKTKKRKKK
jgi:hypothetical protein